MLGDVNLQNQPSAWEIILCKPNKTQIGILNDVFSIKYTARFNDVDELSFSIPYYTLDSNFQQIKNPNWDNVKGDYLILLNNEKYFLIDMPSDTGGDGKDYKTVKCYSYEYILSKKKIRNFQGTRMLYDSTANKAGILNLLEQQTFWRVNYVDSALLTESGHPKVRTFDVSEQTWLEFLQDVKSAFDAIILFDTVHKQLNMYNRSTYGEDKGLYISYENYLKSINKDLKFNELITRLSVYGYNNISINTVNPLGTSYIEDFSYYMDNGYMTSSLKNALIAYNALVESKKGDYQTLLTQLSQLQSTKITKETELTTLQTELIIIGDNIYTAIQSGQTDLSLLYNQQISKQSETDAKTVEIQSIQIQINDVNANISALQQLISKENNFTSAQLEELDDYIHESTWQNANILYVDELYTAGLEAMKQLNQPILEWSIDVADFIKMIDAQHDWDKLVLGDFATINYDKFEFNVQARLVGYTQEYDQNKLTLEFSNRDVKEDVAKYIGDVLSSNTNVGTTVNIWKTTWDMSASNTTLINDIINNDLDASKNAVLAGLHQDIVINEHGITMKSFDNPDYQLKLLSNVIAFTSDGWKHAALSMTGLGLVGEQIYGKVIGSSRLLITNDSGSFIVDGDKMTATDMILSLTRSDGNSKILLNPTDGIKIQSNNVDKFYADTDGLLTLDGKLKITNNGNTLFESYLDTNGGRTKIYDSTGNLNAVIGVESGTAGNMGGTLILFNDSPYDTAPNYNPYRRIEMGIASVADTGIFNTRGSDGNVRVQLGATSTYGYVGVRLVGDDGTLNPPSYITPYVGYIDGERIATQDWVLNLGYATQSWVATCLSTAGYATQSDITNAIASHVAEYHTV